MKIKHQFLVPNIPKHNTKLYVTNLTYICSVNVNRIVSVAADGSLNHMHILYANIFALLFLSIHPRDQIMSLAMHTRVFALLMP